MDRTVDNIINIKLEGTCEEIQDRESLKNNIIIFGLEEAMSKTTEYRIAHDKGLFCKNLILTLNLWKRE